MVFSSAVCEVVRTNELVTNRWTGNQSYSGYIERLLTCMKIYWLVQLLVIGPIVRMSLFVGIRCFAGLSLCR
jgi:hypothetical protein